MTIDQGPFTEWSREYDRLSRPLGERARAVLERCATIDPDYVLSATADMVADRMLAEVMRLGADTDVIGFPAISGERLDLPAGPARPAELRGEDFESHLPC